MASWQYKGICYPDDASAYQGFIDNFGSVTLSGAASGTFFISSSQPGFAFNANGVAGLVKFNLNNGNTTQLLNYVQLKPCDLASAESGVFKTMPVQDMLFVGFLILIFVLGFGHGRGSN